MEKQGIACLYYPTTVICVDDNQSVLQNIQLKLGKISPCKAFCVPEEALAYIEKNMNQSNPLKNIVSINTDSSNYNHNSEQLPLQYNISKIYENIYNKNRFLDISVVVVDYAMPSMNGEDFCKNLRKIKGNTIKIIMLTGEADDPKAIQLFNAGIIDRFLRKAEDGVDEELKNCVTEMQNAFFRNYSASVMQGLESEKDSALGDAVFINFFNKVCHDLSATSYYLIELSGSFIFFNSAGKPTWLIIKSLNELQEIADQIEPHISENLIDMIRKGNVVPYFVPGMETNYYSNEKNLEKSLYKARKLIGQTEYCYALLEELPEFSFSPHKITSFNQYVGSL